MEAYENNLVTVPVMTYMTDNYFLTTHVKLMLFFCLSLSYNFYNYSKSMNFDQL